MIFTFEIHEDERINSVKKIECGPYCAKNIFTLFLFIICISIFNQGSKEI
jgi:hypothetical protein